VADVVRISEVGTWVRAADRQIWGDSTL